MELQARIGQRIRRRREELGMTQQELAGRELTRGFISQLEKGIVMPSLKSLELIASRLYRPVAYFLEETPQETSPDGQAAALVDRALIRLVEQDAGAAQELVRRVADSAGGDLKRTGEDLAPRLEAVRGLLAMLGGDLQEGSRRVQQAIQALKAGGSSRALGLVLAALGCVLARAGRWDEAVVALDECDRLLAELEAEGGRPASFVRACRAVAYARTGRTAEARPVLEALWDQYGRQNCYIMPGEVLVALADCYRAAGEPARAGQALEQAQGLGRALRLRGIEALALERQAELLQSQGEGPRAVDVLSEAARRYRETGDREATGRLQVDLVRMLWEQGRTGEALEKAGQALEDPAVESARVQLLLLRGQILARLDRLDEARQDLELAVSASESAGMSRELAAACSELGRVLRAQGEHARASEFLARAVALYERAGTS
ncbi:MAG: tetratricopeptide repeat protein [Bacillota bacterium]